MCMTTPIHIGKVHFPSDSTLEYPILYRTYETLVCAYFWFRNPLLLFHANVLNSSALGRCVWEIHVYGRYTNGKRMEN